MEENMKICVLILRMLQGLDLSLSMPPPPHTHIGPATSVLLPVPKSGWRPLTLSHLLLFGGILSLLHLNFPKFCFAVGSEISGQVFVTHCPNQNEIGWEESSGWVQVRLVVKSLAKWLIPPGRNLCSNSLCGQRLSRVRPDNLGPWLKMNKEVNPEGKSSGLTVRINQACVCVSQLQPVGVKTNFVLCSGVCSKCGF